ncbi:TetR family transcriptional regulator [Frateuria sp. Soil773]|uniref:TetR/AcrR family transcriptional regulator n=1 Tax=Frateuria sp. Soil773 TaxID=1736407 RepID=UPI0007018207|nr:TetR/AcrR family transcriptional regulator [Frateuria sp. Soil773]KRE89061.1 TetR family transcriptional regulator [Frateuria sp. Soil773]
MTASTRTDRKRARTRDHLAATAQALFERHGYEAVTMEQIAAGADVARGTLYNHFPLKEAVLAHAMHAQLANDLAPLLRRVMARRSVQARLAGVMQASAQWWEAHRGYAAPYIRYRFQALADGQAGEGDSDMLRLYASLIAQAQAKGEIRDDIAATLLSSHLHFLYLGAVLRWLENRQARLADELAGALAFFMAGAAAR